LAVFEYRASLLVVLGMDIGLVPTLEALEALHHRMIRLGDDGAEGAGVVPLELSADKIDVFRRIQEAIGGTVKRDEALAGGDIVEKGCFLLRCDACRVGVDE